MIAYIQDCFLMLPWKYISLPLTYIINISLTKDIFPDALKFAKITQIYKKGSFSNVSNYRPVSVLSVITKIIESVVKNQLVNFLDKFNILSCTQYGFRKHYNTKLAIADVVSEILDHTDKGCVTLGILWTSKKHLIQLIITFFFINYLTMV